MRISAISIFLTLAIFWYGLAAKIGHSTEPACVQYEKALEFMITKLFYVAYETAKMKEIYPKLCDLQILSSVWNDPSCGVDTLPGSDDKITKRDQVLPEDKKWTIFDQNHPTEMADKRCTDHKRMLEIMIPSAQRVGSFFWTIVEGITNQKHGSGYVCAILNRIVDGIQSRDHDGNDQRDMYGISPWIGEVDKIREYVCSFKAHGEEEPAITAPCNQFKKATNDILTKSLTAQNEPRDAVLNAKKEYRWLCKLPISSDLWEDPKCGFIKRPQKDDTITTIEKKSPSLHTKLEAFQSPSISKDDLKCIDYQMILAEMIPLALQKKSNEDIVGSVAHRYHGHVCPIVRKAVEMLQQEENQRNGITTLTNSASRIQRRFCNTF